MACVFVDASEDPCGKCGVCDLHSAVEKLRDELKAGKWSRADVAYFMGCLVYGFELTGDELSAGLNDAYQMVMTRMAEGRKRS